MNPDMTPQEQVDALLGEGEHLLALPRTSWDRDWLRAAVQVTSALWDALREHEATCKVCGSDEEECQRRRRIAHPWNRLRGHTAQTAYRLMRDNLKAGRDPLDLGP